MKWLLVFLVALSLATACVVEDKPVNGGTGGAGGPGGMGGEPMDECGGCSGDLPVCDTATLNCVECLPGMEQACDATAPVCDPVAKVCLCNEDDDCDTPELARCNTTTQQCAPCTTDAHCDDLTDLPDDTNICDDGTCLDCTPDTESETCKNDVSCNPATNECTETEVGSLIECDACVADSECGDGTGVSDAFKCIPLNYQGARFPDEGNGYCLKSVTLGGSCSNPYRIVVRRQSLSEAPEDDYCGINEELATCPAVRALLADTPCDPENGDADCPQPAGLCRELPGAVNSCTYQCFDVVECKRTPAPGSTCNQSLPENTRYCGS